ncbi:MAG: fumarylacetoacetate hydrolase family protein [Candidatus Rokubacteria bacterium]|nr:fumarylacetoacetate hydrolase family protein [Candidatus Rokubacteria bacterium]
MAIPLGPAVERLTHSRATHQAIAPFSESGDLSTDEGYRIQDALRAALEARGERSIGWKVAFTSQTARETFNAHEPASAFLLAAGVFSSGDEVPTARFVQLAVEAEIAFLLKSDLRGPGVTPASAFLAVEGAMPALELIDIRFTGAPRAADLIADGLYANGIVLGRPLTPVPGLDLALEGMVAEVNGRVVATNTAAEVMGNPLNSLAWLANHLAQRGVGLKAGELVMSGSISKLLRPKAGDHVRAAFTRLGSVAARFA